MLRQSNGAKHRQTQLPHRGASTSATRPTITPIVLKQIDAPPPGILRKVHRLAIVAIDRMRRPGALRGSNVNASTEACGGRRFRAVTGCSLWQTWTAVEAIMDGSAPVATVARAIGPAPETARSRIEVHNIPFGDTCFGPHREESARPHGAIAGPGYLSAPPRKGNVRGESGRGHDANHSDCERNLGDDAMSEDLFLQIAQPVLTKKSSSSTETRGRRTRPWSTARSRVGEKLAAFTTQASLTREVSRRREGYPARSASRKHRGSVHLQATHPHSSKNGRRRPRRTPPLGGDGAALRCRVFTGKCGLCQVVATL